MVLHVVAQVVAYWSWILLDSWEGTLIQKHSWWENTGLNNGNCNLVMAPMFSSYANPFSCGFSRNEAMRGGEEQRRFLVFDHSGDQTSLIYSSVVGTQPIWNMNPYTSSFGAAAFHGNGVTNMEDGHGSEDMHEDTEEIDALLYSESSPIDDKLEEDDDEVSTGHSPEELSYRCSSTPTKKRRLHKEELDASLADTASSTRPGLLNYNEERSEASKRLKRKRIQETVSMLRRIIPGGKGKDTVAVLDEAINYLRSLKLRFKKPLELSPVIEGVDIMHQ
ncbi:hypothetical protein J5N97_009693 [Dioscorea zingiberensis]|uniref:BHLH domain-containing protein n=1 Tax=Dioscorea zingiberensis TaxID=325984 RepID=A0A9D5HM44_9LILI|nr:hypothetical protein J5N97_009693 [Dioscorea zingiberensis]